MKQKVQELSISEGRDAALRYPIAIGNVGLLCGAEAIVRGLPNPYTCTRIEKHAGPHVAHSHCDLVAAMWS